MSGAPSSAREEGLRVRVNGESRRVAAGTTVAGLLADLGAGAARCAVEVDGEIVPRSRHAARVLAEGETVEIVTFVGGG